MHDRKFFKRVDVQSTIITMVITVVSTLICFFIVYTITYNDIKHTLDDRAESICEFVKEQLKPEDFEEIITQESTNTERYTILHKNLHEISDVTRVTYIFTAYNDQGTPRYHISNLHNTSKFYKAPGEEITDKTKAKVIRALNGEKVVPSDMIETDDGYYYTFYLPVFDENKEVLCAVGIVFNVEGQYNTYRNLRIFVPFIIVIACIITCIISFTVFKRISNPSKHDMINIDFMTGVKNRNAYQIELDSIIRSKQNEGTAAVMLDLNGLKEINDKFGHDDGDKFIISLATAYRNLPFKPGVMYRIGGDEFIIIIRHATEELIQKTLIDLKEAFTYTSDNESYSYSVGYAIFDPNLDDDFRHTILRADEQMYIVKGYNKK